MNVDELHMTQQSDQTIPLNKLSYIIDLDKNTLVLAKRMS